MKNFLHPLLLLLALWPLAGARAQNCQPDSPIRLTAAELQAARVQSLLRSTRQTYSDAELNEVRTRISGCNDQLASRLKDLENQMSKWSGDYQDVLGFKDVAGIQKQIADLQKALEESEKELGQNLSLIKKYGLYAVLLEGIDVYAAKPGLIGQAEKAPQQQAIEDHNGAYIKRVTTVEEFAEVKDFITSYTSGTVKTDRELFSKVNYSARHFVYAAKLAVTMLDKKAAGQPAAAPVGATVINLLTESGWENRLRARGVIEEDITAIRAEVNRQRASIEAENRDADKRKDNALLLGNEKNRSIQRQIEDEIRKLRLRGRKLKEFTEKFPSVRYNENDLDRTARDLLQHIRNQITELQKQWDAEAEREIVVKETRHYIEGDPTESLAEEVVKLVRQIPKNLLTITRKEEKIEVENLQTTGYQAAEDVVFYREVAEIWAYPVPQQDGSFRIGVFTRFKITGRKEGDGGSGQPLVPDPMGCIFIKGGSFQMGSTDGDGDERPVHSVTLSDYYIGKYEVTQKQWRDIMGTNPSGFKDCDNCPVENVSWNDVQDFLKKLNAKYPGKNYRLPTEAEWEYAARGGNQSRGYTYVGSNNIDDVAWYSSNSDSKTHPVGVKRANELGLFDISGNVWEWCSDWYGDYPSGSQTNPKGPSTGSDRVRRSGSWNSDPRYCRAAYRSAHAPTIRSGNLGFRLARSF